MNEQTNCVLTAKDVEGMRERLKKIQALAKGDRRVGEHCRMLGQTLSKGQRKVLRIEKKVTQSKPHAIMSEEIKTEAATRVEVQGPEKLDEAIKAHLDGVAAGDPVFAEKLKNPKKSLKECIQYIQGEVFHEYVKGATRNGVACAAPSRAEVFGMAVHYYDEEDVKIRAISAPHSGSGKTEKELTEEEKAKIQKAAEAKYEAEVMKDIREREAKKFEKIYKKAKKPFIGLVFGDERVRVAVLNSVEEVRQEAAAMHHCVFRNGYYKHGDNLLLSARDAVTGKRLETVEISLRSFKVMQSRALLNGTSAEHQHILDICQDNIPVLRKAAAKMTVPLCHTLTI